MEQRRTPQPRRDQTQAPFHHYLPRFVLRRWLQEVRTVTSPDRESKGGRKKGRQGEYKQELIDTYDIKSDTLHMGTTDLGKTFGISDMYKDVTDSTDAYRVEKAFSKLESDTARVFKVLDEAEKQGRSTIELVRSQLNTLRKFLFLIHYRNSVQARQFNKDHFDPMTAKMVEGYRIKHGLAGSRAVWLRNLALLLEDEHWEVASDERLLFTAQMDYKVEAQGMQLGLYRAPPGTEFVITENGLGLQEGVSSLMSIMVDMISPGAPNPSYVKFTQSFPITPKLVLITRSSHLMKEETMIRNGVPPEEARRQCYAGLLRTSFFDDLPRTPPSATYIPPLPPGTFDWTRRGPDQWTAEDLKEKEDFQVCGLLNGVPVLSRLKDKFLFAIDDLTEDQAQRVNTLLLTHCKETVSFLTPACCVRAIDAFVKDRELTTEKKDRYASLKAKLLSLNLEEQPVPPSPLPASSLADAAMTERSPSQQTPTPHPSSPPPAPAMAVPVRTSLPGLKGAFNREARPAIPQAVLSEPVPPPSAVSSEEQKHLAETVTERYGAQLKPHTREPDSASNETMGGDATEAVQTSVAAPVDVAPEAVANTSVDNAPGGAIVASVEDSAPDSEESKTSTAAPTDPELRMPGALPGSTPTGEDRGAHTSTSQSDGASGYAYWAGGERRFTYGPDRRPGGSNPPELDVAQAIGQFLGVVGAAAIGGFFGY